MNEAPVWVLTVTVVTAMSLVFGLAAWGLTGLDRLRARRKALRLGCSCCGQSSKTVAKLIAGAGVAICDQCTRLATRHLGAHLLGEHDHPAIDPRGLACSFCNGAASDLRVLATWPGGAICDHCLGVCRDILEADARNPSNAPPA